MDDDSWPAEDALTWCGGVGIDMLVADLSGTTTHSAGRRGRHTRYGWLHAEGYTFRGGRVIATCCANSGATQSHIPLP